MHPALLRIPLARIPFVRSRLVSTEAAEEGSTASKPVRTVLVRGGRLVEEMTPIATFLGVVVSLGAVGVFYSSRLTALEERLTGSASKLEERMAGVIKEVDAKVSGAKDEVDAKVAGAKDEVKAIMAGTTSKLEERVAGIEKAADLKVRSLTPRARWCIIAFLTTLPFPPPQYKTK